MIDAFKKQNGTFYTAESIAKFMIEELQIDYTKNFKLLEPAVGSGNILYYIVEKFIETNKHDKSLVKKIEKTFFAFDKDQNAIENCIKRLDELANKHNINVNWNIFNYSIEEHDINEIGMFDYIISNPPYVTRKNIDSKLVAWLKENSKFCSNSNFDLYYFFIEKALDLWNGNGKIVFITPNSYLRSKSSLKIRETLFKNCLIEKIYDFDDNTLFEDATTYTAISVLKKSSLKPIIIKSLYNDGQINQKNIIEILSSNFYNYEFDYDKYIYLEDIAYVSNGIATLQDKVFIVNENEINSIDDRFIEFSKNAIKYKISTDYIRKVIKPNKIDKILYLIYPNSKDDESEKKIIKNYLENNLTKEFQKRYSIYYGRSQGLKYYEDNKIVIGKVGNVEKGFNLIDTPSYIMSGLYIVLKENYRMYEKQILKYLNTKEIKKYLNIKSKNYKASYKNISSTDLKKIKIPLKVIGGQSES